jgi:hypothetical protein
MRLTGMIRSIYPLVLISLLCGAALTQEKNAPSVVNPDAGYDVRREGTVVGTVISPVKSSATPLQGAHISLQTTAGVVDVHVGDARLFAACHFTIQPGDTLRIIGGNVAFAERVQFVARIIQKGTQALEVRSPRGIPLSYVAPRTGSVAKVPEGVL